MLGLQTKLRIVMLQVARLESLCRSFHVSFGRISPATVSQVFICGQEGGFHRGCAISGCGDTTLNWVEKLSMAGKLISFSARVSSHFVEPKTLP